MSVKLIKLTCDIGSFHEKGKYMAPRYINPQFIESITGLGDNQGSRIRMAMGGDEYQVIETPDEIYKKATDQWQRNTTYWHNSFLGKRPEGEVDDLGEWL
jgi:hypothetical protein